MEGNGGGKHSSLLQSANKYCHKMYYCIFSCGHFHSVTTFSVMTLILMTLILMTLSIMTLSIMTLSIMTLSIMTLSIKSLFITIGINNTLHNNTTILLVVVMLSVVAPTFTETNGMSDGHKAVSNTLAYYNMATIVIRFIVLAPVP